MVQLEWKVRKVVVGLEERFEWEVREVGSIEQLDWIAWWAVESQ